MLYYSVSRYDSKKRKVKENHLNNISDHTDTHHLETTAIRTGENTFFSRSLFGDRREKEAIALASPGGPADLWHAPGWAQGTPRRAIGHQGGRGSGGVRPGRVV